MQFISALYLTLESMALETWNFRGQSNVFSAMTDMDFWPIGRINFQEFIPHGVLNPFPYASMDYCAPAPSSVGVDLQFCSEMLISKPEAMIAQFNKMDAHAGNAFHYNGGDDSDISSCSTEPGYQRHPFGLEFEPVAAQSVELELEEKGAAGVPQIILPCYIRDEAESSRLTLENLFKAYGEAVEREAWELFKVLVDRLQRRVSLIGTHLERVAYYFVNRFRPLQAPDRLMKEICMESSVTAFQALYELYPYARFAHFTANQSIVECFNSRKTKKLHIVDFDVMEGLQWPPLMETIKSLELLRITAVKWDGEDEQAACHDGIISAKKTGSRLSEWAASLGIPFFYEEMRLQDLKNHMICATHNNDICVVFNMMLELPHMTCQRSNVEIMEFLSVARGLRPSILTFASAAVEKNFNATVEYYSALLESLEAGLPSQCLPTSVMEHIFIAPKIHRWVSAATSTHCNAKEKELINEKMVELPGKCGFSGAGVETSEESMEQGWGVVALSRGSWYYTVQKTGAYNNQLLLKWRDTPLVSASSWRN